MEPILNTADKTKAIEVLFFEDAEVQKMKNNLSSFAAFGALSILYLPNYDRFVLHLNDWNYPLLRRLPIFMNSDKTNTAARTYLFPAKNGYFQLTINKIPNLQLLTNFETILTNNANLGFKLEDFSIRRTLEASPDDKVIRHITKERETGPKEIITGMMKQAKEAIKAKYETLTMGSKNLTSRKKALDLKAVKNRNFKKSAHSTFKKDYFSITEKLSNDFLEQRKKNINMNQARSYNDLRKTSGPVLYFCKEEMEQAILLNKDIAVLNNSFQSGFNPLMADIRGRVGGMPQVGRGQNITGTQRQQGEILVNRDKIPESMTHYSG